MGTISEAEVRAFFPFWDHLKKDEAQQLVEYAMEKSYEKGSLVHSTTEKCLGIILVKKGTLRVYIQSEEGRDITLYRLEEGEVCTLSASCFMNEITFEVQMEAEEDSSLLLFPPSTMKQLMEQNIYVENFMYKQTTSRFSDVMWAMQQILFLSFDKRLALFLLEEGGKQDNHIIAMTHEQIAKYIGSAREVVSRMLKYFESEGYVKLSRGKIELQDQDALREISKEL